MTFTPLHRLLGRPPGPLDDELLAAAVSAGISETDDLDWKSELPPAKGLPQTDYPKDIAALANSGGGMIVYGVEEQQKAATARHHVGEFTESHERSLHSAAVTAITPPVFGLEIHQLGTDPRAVAVLVPASVDGPHMIYRNDYFGAPLRNNADTVWMKERQIEAAYRARFDEQRRSSEALTSLYTEIGAGRRTADRAWLIAVASPRVPSALNRPTKDEARAIFSRASEITQSFGWTDGVHPLHNVDSVNPRPGLRRWVALPLHPGDWREAQATVHRNGAVTLAAAIGGHPSGPASRFEGAQIEARGIEAAIADFAGLLRATAEARHHDEYDVAVGIEWTGPDSLTILTIGPWNQTYDGVSTPLATFIPVQTTVNAAAPSEDFQQQVHAMAEDCINQGGVTYLHVITTPSGETP